MNIRNEALCCYNYIPKWKFAYLPVFIVFVSQDGYGHTPLHMSILR